MEVLWRNLVVGRSYYASTTGYLGDGVRYSMTVTHIHVMTPEESMIYVNTVDMPMIKGFAVGGIFEGVIGPKNRFWESGLEGSTSIPVECAVAG